MSVQFKKIDSVTVNYPRWLKGSVSGSALFDTRSRKQCCLGFECLARGLKKKDILDMGTPGCVCTENKAIPLIPGMTGRTGDNLELIAQCMTVNDDTTITDIERMTKLHKLFRRRRLDIKFKNLPKNLQQPWNEYLAGKKKKK